MPKQTQTSWVDLVEWDPLSTSGFTVVRAFLENGEVKLDGNKVVIEQLMQGIDDVLPVNGLLFLKKMTQTFRNPYLLATDVQSGIMPREFGLVEMKRIAVDKNYV